MSIVEFDGRWADIEVKLGDTKVDDGTRSLMALRDKACANKAVQNAKPAFLAVVVDRRSLAYTRPDGVMVIPVALLGA